MHDIFVSYRRHPDWSNWTRVHLRRLLDAYVSEELAERPDIFIDDRIESGADWPNRLGESLGRSKILIAILSGNYFASQWCLHELDLMHGRMLSHPDKILIIPLVGHDGEMIPDEIGRYQPVDIKEFRNTDLQMGTARYEKFADKIGELAPSIAMAISSAPQFDPSWVQGCRSRFDALYRALRQGDLVLPVTTFTPKEWKPLSLPPRVSL